MFNCPLLCIDLEDWFLRTWKKFHLHSEHLCSSFLFYFFLFPFSSILTWSYFKKALTFQIPFTISKLVYTFSIFKQYLPFCLDSFLFPLPQCFPPLLFYSSFIYPGFLLPLLLSFLCLLLPHLYNILHLPWVIFNFIVHFPLLFFASLCFVVISGI